MDTMDDLGGVALEGGAVYQVSNYKFASFSGVFAFEAATGKPRWSKNGAPVGYPSAGQGQVFVVERVQRERRLVARSQENGETRWSVALKGALGAAPALGGGLVVVGTDKGELVAFDAGSGQERWRFESGVKHAPVVGNETSVAIGANERVVFTVGKEVVLLDLKTGAVRWRGEVAVAAVHSPILAGGRLYVVSGPLGLLVAAKLDGAPIGFVEIVHGGQVRRVEALAEGALVLDRGEVVASRVQDGQWRGDPDLSVGEDLFIQLDQVDPGVGEVVVVAVPGVDDGGRGGADEGGGSSPHQGPPEGDLGEGLQVVGAGADQDDAGLRGLDPGAGAELALQGPGEAGLEGTEGGPVGGQELALGQQRAQPGLGVLVALGAAAAQRGDAPPQGQAKGRLSAAKVRRDGGLDEGLHVVALVLEDHRQALELAGEARGLLVDDLVEEAEVVGLSLAVMEEDLLVHGQPGHAGDAGVLHGSLEQLDQRERVLLRGLLACREVNG